MTRDDKQDSLINFVGHMMLNANLEQADFIRRMVCEWNRLPGHDLEGQSLPKGYAA